MEAITWLSGSNSQTDGGQGGRRSKHDSSVEVNVSVMTIGHDLLVTNNPTANIKLRQGSLLSLADMSGEHLEHLSRGCCVKVKKTQPPRWRSTRIITGSFYLDCLILASQTDVLNPTNWTLLICGKCWHQNVVNHMNANYKLC